tara:strand:- start:31 stop:318 length:288 start_codon:yes stop_codon:yes gene_type:complete
MRIQITSIDHLMKVAKDDDSLTDSLEFYFSNGIAKSSKTIRYFADSDGWEVFHYISDAWEEWESTYDFVRCEYTGGMIYNAIKKGEFYVERFDSI